MDEPGKRIDLNSELGMTRRDLIRRGAIVGGTLLWVAPAIQSMAPKAFAQEAGPGSAKCSACYCYSGSLNSPSKEAGEPDFFTDPGQANATDCDAWCKGTAPYTSTTGAHRGPYEHSIYCSGTHCNVGVAVGAGQHGAFCT